MPKQLIGMDRNGRSPCAVLRDRDQAKVRTFGYAFDSLALGFGRRGSQVGFEFHPGNKAGIELLNDSRDQVGRDRFTRTFHVDESANRRKATMAISAAHGGNDLALQ